jgi:hypothetical protein
MPVAVNLYWIFHTDSFFCNYNKLNFVVSFLISVKHRHHAVSYQLLGILLAHISFPVVFHKHLAVMDRQTSEQVAMLNFGTI